MYSWLLLFFLLLFVSLFLSFYHGKKKLSIPFKIFRYFSIISSLVFFSYFFLDNFLAKYSDDTIPVKISNLNVQEMNFYIISKSDGKNELFHLGRLKNGGFMVNYLDVLESDEMWVAGLDNKQNVLYFSSVPLKEENKEIELDVENLSISDVNMSVWAQKKIKKERQETIKEAVWISFDLFLLLLNFILLFKNTSSSKG